MLNLQDELASVDQSTTLKKTNVSTRLTIITNCYFKERQRLIFSLNYCVKYSHCVYFFCIFLELIYIDIFVIYSKTKFKLQMFYVFGSSIQLKEVHLKKKN